MSRSDGPESGEDASADEDGDEDDDDSKNGTDQEDLQAGTGKLSPSHRTGLAKLPSVMEWLAHALGRRVTFMPRYPTMIALRTYNLLLLCDC